MHLPDITILHIIYQQNAYEGHAKNYEFSGTSMREHGMSGYEETKRTLKPQEEEPNSLGHNFMFSKLDRTDGSVRFFDEREPERNGQMILAALAVFPLVEPITDRLDDLIPKISLHHRMAPPV